MFKDDELMSIFLEESTENLQSMEEALLELEKLPYDNELLNVVFRAIHTIKGGAGLMGLELISNLAHRLENILDEIRQYDSGLPAEALDLLFAGVDFFRRVFSSGSLESDSFNAQAEDLLKTVQRYTEEREDGGNHFSAGDQILSAEFSTLARSPDNQPKGTAIAPGEPLQIDVRLYSDCILKSVRAYMVLKAVENQAEIIQVDPSLQELEEEDFETFTLTVISHVEPQELQEAIEGISEIAEVQISIFDEDGKDVFQELLTTGGAYEPKNRSAAAVLENVQTQKQLLQQDRIDTIRVETNKLEDILNSIAELLIAQSRVKELFHRFSDNGASGEAEAANAFQETDKIIRGLQEDVMKASMVPVSSIFTRFRRMVRDLARERNKEVELIIEGEETELDKKVIEQIADPLKHLIRNAVDHGLESLDERIAQGKPATGTIKLEALHQEGNVVIKIGDDGRGIDEEAILEKAREKSLIETGQELSTAEIHRLLFKPGFSTAHEVSDLSGRGVGLDVVLHNIRSLHGDIEVSTEKGQGTSFNIRLPLTQAIIDGMMVRVGEERFVLPLVSIIEFIKAQPGDIRRVEGKGAILSLRHEFIPYSGLYQYLQLDPEFKDPETGILVILQEGRKKLALLVDDILGQEQIVIKNITENMEPIDGIAGATILGDGRVAMILDVGFLFRRKVELETDCETWEKSNVMGKTG